MRKAATVLLILAASLVFGSQIAWTGNPIFANVTASAENVVAGTDVIVDAGLIQKDTPSSGPFVSTVTFSLEQHFPNEKFWSEVAGSSVVDNVNTTFDLLPAGERYDVATNDYDDICGLVDPGANAVRAVVQITVDNANDKRPGGNTFTGRSTGFPNPCK